MSRNATYKTWGQMNNDPDLKESQPPGAKPKPKSRKTKSKKTKPKKPKPKAKSTKQKTKKKTVTHDGRKYTVRTGERGGKYILKKGKKVYL